MSILRQEAWGIYPFSSDFWKSVTVQAIDPALAYFGPLPQTSAFTRRVHRTTLSPAYVYVIQDIEGDVLYVGKTINLPRRMSNHRRRKGWWPKSGQLTVLGVYGEDLAEVNAASLRLEALTIRHLQPIYNIAGNR